MLTTPIRECPAACVYRAVTPLRSVGSSKRVPGRMRMGKEPRKKIVGTTWKKIPNFLKQPHRARWFNHLLGKRLNICVFNKSRKARNGLDVVLGTVGA